MPLIVEDGTGLEDGESYVGSADFLDFCDRRQLDIPEAVSGDGARVEAALRDASEYADTIGEVKQPPRRFRGARVSGRQALQFPRVGMVEADGHAVEGIPLRFRNAVCILAHVQLTGTPLSQVLERGGQIVSESVGPISTTYAAGAPAGVVIERAEQLLATYWRDAANNRPAPAFAEPSEGHFSMGMHDNPASVTE